jgi:glycerol uptake facilitator-like aquaporin
MMSAMRSLTTPRLIGELLGTALLVFFGAGALALTSNASITAVSFLIITILVSWIFRGGHFNPWVTLACAIRGTVAWISAAILILVQLAGGILGGLLMLSVYFEWISNGLGATQLRTTGVGPDNSSWLIPALVAETVAVFLLACVVFALDGDSKLGVGMGLAYAAGALSFSTLTGASMNLARTVGPQTALSVGGGTTDWPHLWIYLVSGVLGAALAGLLYPLWSPAAAGRSASDPGSAAKEPAE